MGCDIHCALEYKEKESSFSSWNTYATDISLGRSYTIFGLLANVRGPEELLGPPKGVPEDASFHYKDIVEKWGDDGHSHSYCSTQEWRDVLESIGIPVVEIEYVALLGTAEILEATGNHECRFVFFFDN